MLLCRGPKLQVPCQTQYHHATAILRLAKVTSHLVRGVAVLGPRAKIWRCTSHYCVKSRNVIGILPSQEKSASFVQSTVKHIEALYFLGWYIIRSLLAEQNSRLLF